MRKSLATATLAALFAALTFFSPSAQTYSQDAVTKWFTDMTAAMNDKEVGIENFKKISASACTQASENTQTKLHSQLQLPTEFSI